MAREDEALTPVILPDATRASPPEPAALDAAPLRPADASRDPAALARQIAAKVVESLDDAKAEDVVSLDLAGKTSIADVMVVASGRSNTHVGAMAERLLKALKEAGCATPRIEGQPQNDWVLVDAGDVIVHLFRPEVRQFYNLEKLWGADRPAERRAL